MSSDVTSMMESIVSGQCSDAAIADFLIKLKQNGESAEDIVAASRVMRRHAVALSKFYPDVLDTCGTGGDGSQTLNVSTLAALTVSACGVRVAKHGNRSVSSQCGSADVLEMLGVAIDIPLEAVEACLEAVGFSFFFAPKFHPATRYAMAARKKIKGKTLFNILGPLANPAGAGHQLIGVYEERLVPVVAEALRQLGAQRALVVHGLEGLDELSLCGPTQMAELKNGGINYCTVSPPDFGLASANLKDLQCASKEECRAAAQEVLDGQRGPKAQFVALNAAAALYAAGRTVSIRDGITMAKEKLESGEVKRKLEAIVTFTQKAALAGSAQ